MLRILLIMVIATGACFCQTGTLSGVVQEEGGKAVVNATVAYVRLHKIVPPGRNGRLPDVAAVSGRASTGVDGRFLKNGLPVGQYRLCAIGPEQRHFASCEWGRPWRIVRVEADRSSEAVLEIGVGAVVTFQVQDQGNRLATGERFLLGLVTSEGHYGRAKLMTRGQGSSQYALTVPRSAALRMVVDTPLAAKDERSQPIEKQRPSISITAPASGNIVVPLRVD
jgi:hypothetical protein